MRVEIQGSCKMPCRFGHGRDDTAQFKRATRVSHWKISTFVISRRLGDRAFLLGATSEMQPGHELLTCQSCREFSSLKRLDGASRTEASARSWAIANHASLGAGGKGEAEGRFKTTPLGFYSFLLGIDCLQQCPISLSLQLCSECPMTSTLA